MSGFLGCLLAVFGVMCVPVTADGGGDPSVRLLYLDPWPSASTTAGAGACPPSMCDNGGTCVVEEGQHRCRCTPQFTGYRCQELLLDLACDRRGMRLRVVKSALADLGVNVSALHTSSGFCAAEESLQYVSVTLTHEDHVLCGTAVQVNGTHLIYSNDLSSGFRAKEADIPENSISRSADIRISFSCVYHYDGVVSLPFPLLTSASLVVFSVEEGQFNVSMTLHPSEDFLDPYVAPPMIPLSARLYVQLQILGHDPRGLFTLQLDECWATPGPDPSNRIRHQIITSGIASDSTAAILDLGNQSVSRFSLQMFHFVKFPEFFLHCRVWLQLTNGSNCCDQPKIRISRHVREVSDPYRKVVTCGPIRLIPSHTSSVRTTDIGLSPVIFPASFAVAAALLLLALVTVAKILKKRAKGRALPPICSPRPPDVPPAPPLPQ